MSRTSTTVHSRPTCDLCEDAPATVDGKTNFGPWAYMCDEDFELHGLGLGTGRGQRLIVEEES